MNEFNQMYTFLSMLNPTIPQQAQPTVTQASEPSKFESMLQRKQEEAAGQKPAETEKPSEPKAEQETTAARDEVYKESYVLAAAMTAQPHIVYMMDDQAVQQPETPVVTAPVDAGQLSEVQPVSTATRAPGTLTVLEHPGEAFELPAEKPAAVPVSEASAKPEQAAPQMEQPVEMVEETPEQPRQEHEDTTQTDARPQTQPQAVKEEKKSGEVPVDWNRPVFEKLETVPVKVAAPEKPAPKLALDAPDAADRLGEKVVNAFLHGEQEIELQLSPEGLGRLNVVISKAETGVLSVVLHAANPKAAALLQQHGEGLANTIAGAAKTEVHVEVREPQSQQQPQFMDPNGQNGRQQRQPQQEQRQRHSGDEDFMQKLRLGLVDLSYAV